MENKVITVVGVIRSNGNTIFRMQIQNKKYYPRQTIFGFYSCLTSDKNVSTFLGANINSGGELNIWMNAKMEYDEDVMFIYPIKTEGVEN